MRLKIWLTVLITISGAGINPGFLFSGSLNLDYSTYLGGTYGDEGMGITVGTNGMAYVAGYTASTDFPVTSSYQSSASGGSDIFVTAFNSDGSTLFFSTYLGGSDNDSVECISLGTDGKVYLSGDTLSLDFPTVNPYQASLGGQFDVFLTALTPDGSGLYYSTYLGGGWGTRDQTFGITLDTEGRAYLAGLTGSPNFPTVNPYQASLGGGFDAFVTVFDSGGSTLAYSTFLGGAGYDEARGIALGSDGTIYTAGYTESTDFPLENSYQSTYNGYDDAFVTALSTTGTALTYSTYLGGGGEDQAKGIAVRDNTAYITGYTTSGNFPTASPYQPGYGGDYDAFITTLSSAGAPSYSTYLGGSLPDRGLGISLGTDGNTLVTGWTRSLDFPTANPYQPASGGDHDAFVSILSSTGSFLSYSTYLGGNNSDEGWGICLGTDSMIYLTGQTYSLNFPLKNAYQQNFGGDHDAFVSRLGFAITPTPVVTPTVVPTPSLIPTPSVIPTPSQVPTSTPPPSATPTNTPVPSSTPTPTVTPTASVTPTSSPTPSAIPTPTIPTLTAPPWITDYNGDGTSDIAIFRSGSGLWAVRGVTRVYFGGSTDETVPGDYNGDGTTEIGIFRKASGLWAVRGVTRVYFGGGSDIPEPGDYNGDLADDIGIFRPAAGLWAIRGITRIYFGGSSDNPIPGYYIGDATKSIGIFRPASGLWAIRGISRVYFGSSGDETVPGGYDGDWAWDYGIFRPASGLWAIRGVTRSYFGATSDLPVPADYDGSGMDDIGIFRGSSGLWAVKVATRVYFGSIGDIPVTR